jgi:hypothetical protein
MINTLSGLRLPIAIAAVLFAVPVFYAALWLTDPKLVKFGDLELGASYMEGHQRLGWKRLTKVAPDVASAFREMCGGRKFNDFVSVKPDHKVKRIEDK